MCVRACVSVRACVLSFGCLSRSSSRVEILPKITAVIAMAMMMVNDDDCHLSDLRNVCFTLCVCVCVCMCVCMCPSSDLFDRFTQSSHHPVTAARELLVIGSVFPETMSSFFTPQWASYIQEGLNISPPSNILFTSCHFSCVFLKCYCGGTREII